MSFKISLTPSADGEPLLIVTADGHQYTLEEADELESEAAMLGRSEKFMAFLESRRREEGSIPLETIEETLRSSPETAADPSPPQIPGAYGPG